MKAVLDDIVLAEAHKDDLVRIEGNWYFPPESVKAEHLEESRTPYFCPWKGECQYLSVRTGGTVLQDRAWSYPDPIPSSFERVGRDYSGYVAFWKEVRVVE